MFGKRPACTRDETNLEETLLDLEIKRTMLAEYGSARPPEGIFRRVLRKIQARESRAGIQARIPRPAFDLLKAMYARAQRLASSATATRLMPAAMALILLVVMSDLNIQQLAGSTAPLQFISSGNQARPVQESTWVSFTAGTVDTGWSE
ncbi:MAG: hypothetical protein M3328_02930, partial [Chloroflexota bacterium]|nr:hypothetical protein [Chloroflexota bacterium]